MQEAKPLQPAYARETVPTLLPRVKKKNRSMMMIAPRTAHARRTGRAAAAERRRTVREETATVTACALT